MAEDLSGFNLDGSLGLVECVEGNAGLPYPTSS